MVKHYLIITTPESYSYDIKNEFLVAGFPKRNEKSIKNFNEGDKIIYYITKISKFATISEVTGEYFFSKKPLWSDVVDEWPHRVPTKPLYKITNEDNMVYIKDIWDDLEFISNKNKWGSQVMGSFKRISEHDFNVIFKNIQKVGE